MAHVVTSPCPPFPSRDGSFSLHQIPTANDNFTWLIVARDGSEVAAVDGPDAESTLRYCREREVTLTTIINTHTHFDHIGINADLERRGLLDGMRVIGPRRAPTRVPGLTEAVDDGDRVTVAGCAGTVLLTEGHIDGHVSFVFSDVLFCGDTLFGGGCGYLFDGPPSKMFESLRRLSALDGRAKVCCAHEYTQDNLRFAWSVEPDNDALAERIRTVWQLRDEGRSTVPSTIEIERATNPFLRTSSQTIRKNVARALNRNDFASEEDVFAATRALKDRKDYKRLTDGDLPLR